MEESNKILVIVDFQKDFFDKENGSLYVPGAEKALDNILEYIKKENIVGAYLTADWHTLEDESFSVNGGEWPVHCLQYSEGAGISNKIFNALKEKGVNYEIFTKGETKDHEEYGAFECDMDEYNRYNEGCRIMTNFSETCQSAFYLAENSNNVEYIICGLAGDYCVFQTYSNLKNKGVRVTPFYDGMAFINDKFSFEDKYVPSVEKTFDEKAQEEDDDIKALMQRIQARKLNQQKQD